MSNSTVPKQPMRLERATGRRDPIATIGSVPPLVTDDIVTVPHGEPAAAR